MVPNNERIMYLCLGFFICAIFRYFYDTLGVEASGNCDYCSYYVYVIIALCAVVIYILYNHYKLLLLHK